MLRTGHYGAALCFYAPVGLLMFNSDLTAWTLGGFGVLALAQVPDLDFKIPFVKHRGITHTLPFLVTFAGAAGWSAVAISTHLGIQTTELPKAIAIVSVTALGSHLASDTLTPAGIPLLWPITNDRISFDFVTAANPFANYALLLLGVTANGIVLHSWGM